MTSLLQRVPGTVCVAAARRGIKAQFGCYPKECPKHAQSGIESGYQACIGYDFPQIKGRVAGAPVAKAATWLIGNAPHNYMWEFIQLCILVLCLRPV